MYSMIWGNQKCRGGIPAFIHRVNKISISLLKKKLDFINKKFIIEKIINKVEDIAWTRKYLITDSVEIGLYLLIIRGIIINKFSSKPTHLVNHDAEEAAVTVPVISNMINIIS